MQTTATQRPITPGTEVHEAMMTGMDEGADPAMQQDDEQQAEEQDLGVVTSILNDVLIADSHNAFQQILAPMASSIEQVRRRGALPAGGAWLRTRPLRRSASSSCCTSPRAC
jgi:hypothetical protein